MKAIEITSKTDNEGHLRIDYQLDKKDSDVRVLILVEDDVVTEQDEETLWMKSIAKNPAFAFLSDPEEDIYSIEDGKPLED